VIKELSMIAALPRQSFTRLAIVAFLLIAAACGSSNNTVVPPTGTIGLSLSPTSTTVQQGGTTALPGSYRRLQAMFTLAADYTSASLTYSSSSSGGMPVGQFIVSQSAPYLGSVTTVTLTPPDFSTIPGFQSMWGPNTTGALSYTVAASSTAPPTRCAQGATIRTASSSVGGD